MEDHIDPLDLVACARGELAEERSAEILAHCQDCRSCRDVLVVVVAMRQHRHRATHAVRRRRYLRAATALLLLALGVPVAYLVSRASFAPEAHPEKAIESSSGVPEASAGVPADSSGVAGDSSGTPEESSGTPEDSSGPPEDSFGMLERGFGASEDVGALPPDLRDLARLATNETVPPTLYQIFTIRFRDSAPAGTTSSLELRQADALADIQRGEYVAGIRQLRDLWSEAPGHPVTAAFLGIAAYLSGEGDEVVEELLSVGAESGVEPVVRFAIWYLANLYLRNEQPEKASLALLELYTGRGVDRPGRDAEALFQLIPERFHPRTEYMIPNIAGDPADPASLATTASLDPEYIARRFDDVLPPRGEVGAEQLRTPLEALVEEDFGTAIPLLEELYARHLANRELATYLGIAEYLTDGPPDRVWVLLDQGGNHARNSIARVAKWYMANHYLKAGDVERAMRAVRGFGDAPLDRVGHQVLALRQAVGSRASE